MDDAEKKPADLGGRKVKNIVILGGGVGGLATATKLRRLLPRENRVTVIDRQEKQYYYPDLVWLMRARNRGYLPQPFGPAGKRD